MPRICIVQPAVNVVSETFIRAHGERLNGVVGVVHQRNRIPWVGDRPALSQAVVARLCRKISRIVVRNAWEREIEAGNRAALRGFRSEVVLAEYGTTGVEIAGVCRSLKIPLVVHFHGFDASSGDVLKKHGEAYFRMFQQAAAVIAVSRAMEQQLLVLGCPRAKLIYSPYGIDCHDFEGARAADSSPTLVAVGRFVEKKAPYLTLMSFARIAAVFQHARLRMIGDGPLLGVCRDLAIALGIKDRVEFLGAQRHEVVQREMRQARAFVQHSVVASNGDAEGTPLAVLEAGAIGLPVIASRHAGIPDVVIDGDTGLLFEERDVAGMAEHMLALISDPARAGELGRNAAVHVRKFYTIEQSLGRLSRVLEAAVRQEDMASVRTEIESRQFVPGGRTGAPPASAGGGVIG